MSLPIAILAGGFATRLNPITLEIPKSLILIKGYPFIGWQLKLLAKSGVENIVLCLGHKFEPIMEYVGNGNEFDLHVEYSIEESPLGTGGALRRAEALLGESFGVLYGDSYLPINFQNIIRKFKELNTEVLMTVYKNKGRWDKSNAMVLSNNKIRYSKRNPTKLMNFIDYGFSVLKSSVLETVPRSTFFNLSELWETLSQENRIDGHIINERFYEIGSHEGIVDFENFLNTKEQK